MMRLSEVSASPPISRNRAATASRRAGSRLANAPPDSRSSDSSTVVTCAASRPKLRRMSAKIASSPAPGTRYSGLGGIIISARQRSDRCCSADRECSIVASVEQGCQALLDAVRDIERQRLDGARRIYAGRGDEDAAVDDEQVLHVVA